MIYINEFFPNPAGQEAAGEFIELYNSVGERVRLDGYSLSVGSKKNFSLSGYTIGAQGYLALKKDQTKLTLKNSDGVLLLYGPDGNIVDEAQFAGAAPEGASFSRTDYTAEPTQHFIFAPPTPGVANGVAVPEVLANSYAFNTILSPHLSLASFILMAAGTGISLLAALTYIIYNNGILSDIIFGGDKTTRERTG